MHVMFALMRGVQVPDSTVRALSSHDGGCTLCFGRCKSYFPLNCSHLSRRDTRRKKRRKNARKKKEKIREIGKKYWKREKEGKKERKKQEREKTINCGLKGPHIVPDGRRQGFFSFALWSRTKKNTEKLAI